jgi:hypothetical protein
MSTRTARFAERFGRLSDAVDESGSRRFRSGLAVSTKAADCGDAGTVDRDRMIDPALQQEIAKNIDAKVTRVNTSHVAMISQPQAVADAIIAASRAAH